MLAVAISLFLLAISAGCSGFFINPSLSSIYINPASATVAVGGKQVQLIAYGKYSDGSQSEISGASVSWSSSNLNVATITPGGLVTGVNTGTATMTASSQGVTATANVSVTLTNITTLVTTTILGSAVQQTAATISGAPLTLQFYAYGNGDPSNDLTEAVTWTSSVTSVATISSGLSGGGNGVASSVAAGTTNITASTTNSSTGQPVQSQPIALTVQ
ncbi:MAG: Ig-like domain-containing protein [Acidobacteriota bacterium]|nr:Ig-like domain-containing protein [Acidobacteriota bacterium]